MTPEVTFLIPCLNEEETLPAVIGEIRSSYISAQLDYEILVADNGSDDDSTEIAESLGARVEHVHVRGYGSALRGGIEAAAGRIVVMGDADGSYTFGDAKPMIDRVRDGAALVMGNRFLGGIAPGAMPPLHRYLGNPVLSFMGRVLFRVPVGDFHCGLRAFDTEAVRALALRSSGMEFASEMLVLAAKSKLRIEEVPATLIPDLRSRRPHLRTWRDGWRHLRFLLSHSPSWTFFVPGAFAGVLAILIAVLSFLGPLDTGGIEFSYRTSIVAMGLAIVSLVNTWIFFLAKRVATGTVAKIPYLTEIQLGISAVVFLAGAIILIVQSAGWAASGFGSQALGRDLLTTIWAVFLLAAGGCSGAIAMLSGLVRTTR